mgnify:CR=1 FL=1
MLRAAGSTRDRSTEQDQAGEDLQSQFQVADIKGDPNFWSNLIKDEEDSEDERSATLKQILPPRRCTVKSYSEAEPELLDDPGATTGKKRKRSSTSSKVCRSCD